MTSKLLTHSLLPLSIFPVKSNYSEKVLLSKHLSPEESCSPIKHSSFLFFQILSGTAPKIKDRKEFAIRFNF